ncbi:MAG: hypothetical protein J7K36_05335 [Archaeoglobaceae archaeon]|nr:hypothetical protein [Archaeoglobaceae archaeon]
MSLKRRLENIENRVKHQKKPKLWITYSTWNETENVAVDENDMIQQILKKYGCKSLEELKERFKLFMIHIGLVEIDKAPNGEVIEKESGGDKIYFHDCIIP